MYIYLAGTHKLLKDNPNINFLGSFHYKPKHEPEFYKRYILDSGAFSLLSSVPRQEINKIDWEEYIHKYSAYIRANKVRNYIELDIDSLIGYDAVLQLTKKLEALVGWKSMPVWHMNRGWEGWERMVSEYSYICFGSFVTEGLPQKDYVKIHQYLKFANDRKVKVHGLGFTMTRMLRNFAFYSVDSTTWSYGSRSGITFHFDPEQGIIRQSPRPKGFKAIAKAIDEHNLREWLKFIEYAEHNFFQWKE